MSSYFGWLDYSEEEKRKMLDAINLWKEKETRDELGLGVIRDTFADIFFPGTSTIQTAAKYFLFIPWIYLKLEASKANSDKITVRARRYEILLIYSLLEGSDELTRIIGNSAKDSLQRLPSSIYWAGLYKWKLRLFDGSQDQYHRQIDYYYKQKNAYEIVEDENFESGTERGIYNWNINLRKIMPKNFLKNDYKTDLKLNKSEAKFLREQVLLYLNDTLLAFLVDNGNMSNTPFPWQHELYNKFPKHVKHNLKHAENFSLIMHGASLLYNYILAVKTLNISNSKPDSKPLELVNDYKKRINEWRNSINNNIQSFTNWERDEFWEIINNNNPRVSIRTKYFINTWLDYLNNNFQKLNLIKDDFLIQHITKRESDLKREELCRITNRHALENWSGASGTQQIDYRWKQTQIIINDILEGLKNE